ncbi:MAG: nitrate ABC transporter, permease protein, partial [Hyphomicrobium sp.]
MPLAFRAFCLSLAILVMLLGIWQIATAPTASVSTNVDPEYAALVSGAAAEGQKSGFPTPSEVATTLWNQLKNPFYVRGPNDQGIGIQL